MRLFWVGAFQMASGTLSVEKYSIRNDVFIERREKPSAESGSVDAD